MSDEPAYSSPWISAEAYRIILASSGLSPSLTKQLEAYKLRPFPHTAGMHYVQTGQDWASSWHVISALLSEHGAPDSLMAAVIAGEGVAEEREIGFHLKPWREIDGVAKHLWLAEALQDQRLVCFMQRVVDKRGKQIGYEAFARIEQEDGSIVGGGAIMEASRALRMEYLLDRMMHKQAIRNYVEGDLEGYLFINFLTGFIHRPEVYLEGLSQAVNRHRILTRFIVLDIPVPAFAADTAKLKGIAEYCRSRGFAIALDDVFSAQGLESLLIEVKPGFVKLDAKIAKTAHMLQSPLTDVVRLSHEAGAMVLAEGVESEELHNLYLAAGADLFQGYLFGKPERRNAKERSTRNAS